MQSLGRLTRKKAFVGVGLLIVVGGVVLGLGSSQMLAPGAFGSFSGVNAVGGQPFDATLNQSGGQNDGPAYTVVVGQGTTQTVTTFTQSTTTESGLTPGASVNSSSPGTRSNPGGSIEFSSELTLQSTSPGLTASRVAAMAYSVGGYVAYQSTYSSSADVVIRVPAGEYQQVLGMVESLGTVVSLTSNSNDVRVQYTDLNATLDSLRTEQGALLRLLNESSTINSTLAIEGQLQGVDQQINTIESQILQTRTLIDFSTIDVTIGESAQPAPLSLSLTATPRNGLSPLSVTFNAVVRGGAQPYIVNYNFGDGYASEGQIVIHTFYQQGDYNVSVTATDQNGTSAERWVVVHATAPPGQSGFQNFFGSVSALFVSVIEGIVEVAVVVLPIAALGAAVIIPIQRRARGQKGVRQP